MSNFKKNIVKTLSLMIAPMLFMSACSESVRKESGAPANSGVVASNSYVSKSGASIKTNQENYYDSNVIYQLPDNVNENDTVSVIVTMNRDSLVDVYKNKVTNKTLSEFSVSEEAKALTKQVRKDQEALIKKLNKTGINYTLGEKYDTVLSGFEITVKAKDFEKVGKTLQGDASVIVGDVYLPAETQVVTNEVDVYDTGIFDGSKSGRDGTGVVVAVLDTGLDYTHSAFSVDNFTAEASKDAFTLSSVSSKVSQTVAADFTGGLTGEDVYVSRKVPFAYDYGDKDPDVLPINSEHGTHVAGIIAGKDNTITGVAPNAQLAIMKVFSDIQQGAKTSWILAALEDCVTLGVDVINMSLGSSCGFAREEDGDKVNDIYDSIREAGISLIVSAGNSYNSTFGSEKNGSLGLTSNPDSGTVGSPSTYAAPLSVASVDGVKTPYLVYNDDIIYFNEASTSDAKSKDFVSDILKTQGANVLSHEFEYVTIPGIGRSSDYPEEAEFYKNKIVLVKRGTSTFEDKVRVALTEKGAAGIIIYNNVSGTISMAVGADVGAVCSISQDEGEKLAAAGTGKILISRNNVAGPFMSDFSSWGPTSDLQIKPEITAHGGEILSAVPGHTYDRLSGTSMAAPNQAGAAALIREYVKYSGEFGTSLTPKQVTDIVNQLMMSTTDILLNKNGLPYAVRKQGAGLVNIKKAATSSAYLTTFDKNNQPMEKSKLELGDDKAKTGIYTMSFAIHNITGVPVSYDVSSIVMTEGVSETYTSHGDTTVTQDGYLLSGAQTSVTAVTNGSANGNLVTVGAEQSATVTVKIVLSDADKKYMDDSFAHGMYVEGFIKLKAGNGANADLNLPLLAFYGDWTEAPIFDEEYYDTHKDEINAGLNPEDKLMADAYATRVVGGLYSDYIATLGSYYFIQDPNATQIAASKEHIALSNQESEYNATISSIKCIWAGLLRNAKEVNITITEDATGKVIFNETEINQRKSYSQGTTVYQSTIDVDFSVLKHNLKNNTKYTVKATSYIDYGAKEDQKNVRNTFEFPLYIDFQAPVVQDVIYRTEYDRTTQKTHLYADIQVYDNHYAMGMQIGQITPTEPGSQYKFSMNTFGKYVTPVYSSFNSTSTVTVELTDYVARLKESASIDHVNGNANSIVYNNNSFIAVCYDYAMNSATYEIRLPDEILAMNFKQEEAKLSPNETLDLTKILDVYPSDSWMQTLDFTSSNPDIADVVNQTVIAKTSGEVTITATGYNKKGEAVTAELKITVLAEGDEGYVKYDVPAVNKFSLTGYYVNKAYHHVSTEDREIGVTEGTYDFGGSLSLSMFPSESVTLQYALDSNFPEKTKVKYSVGNSRIATISEDGTIVAQAEGTTIITALVTFDGEDTFYSERVTVTVKDPYTTSGMYLMSYMGLGGEVVIPSDRGITMIYSYAFSNYKYVDKDLEAGDVIDEEDPYLIKQMYIGDDTITKIVIPEGVTAIESYAFANLTALEEIVLPKSLFRIGLGAFYGCKNLKTITEYDVWKQAKSDPENADKLPKNTGLKNAKFINQEAFAGCALEEVSLDSVVAIGNYTFRDCKLNYLKLPASSQSLGIGAFYNNDYLTGVEFKAPKIKIGTHAFAECDKLEKININADVLAAYAFYNCGKLSDVTLGKDVVVIGEYAFARTAVAAFKLAEGSKLTLEESGAHLLKNNELIMVAPMGTGKTVTTSAKAIAAGAFAGNGKIYRLVAPNVEEVGAYAFADCPILEIVEMDSVKKIGAYAFAGTALTATPDLANVTSIGDYAFAGTKVTEVTIADNTNVGKYAFGGYEIGEQGVRYCEALETVTIGNNVTVGEGAFKIAIDNNAYDGDGLPSDYAFNKYYTAYKYTVQGENGEKKEYNYWRYDFAAGVHSNMTTVTIGDNVTLGDSAFSGNANLTNLTIGNNVEIGNYAFFDAAALASVDLSGVKTIGDGAFSGSNTQDYWQVDEDTVQVALIKDFINGKETALGYKSSSFAPKFTTANLTNVESVGKGAFEWNDKLTTITFGDKVQEIAERTFANCESVTSVSLPAQIKSVGDYAFYNTKISETDITNVDKVGAYAFSGTRLKEVELKAGASVLDGAFASCEQLATVVNLDKVTYIGAEAFLKTALTEVNVPDATFIGDFAFGDSAVTKVTLGKLVKDEEGNEKYVSAIQELGENPFSGCAIETFGKEEDETFNNKVIGKKLNENYAVSDTVQVIDGVLYQKVATGLELVSYPVASEATDYAVVEGTARITAKAFAESKLQSVTIASTVQSIGDKAFYGCDKLAVVTFKSYNAPALEEAFDPLYPSYDTLPFTGKMASYVGLGIAPYYMWNATSGWTTFYFGANFVDYVGQTDGNLVMVKPANGQNYDSFIFNQYFGARVEGLNAATEATLAVIATIEKLPAAEIVKLTDKATVEEARAAFNMLSEEQQALVSNLDKLKAAEDMITYLESKVEQPPVDQTPEKEGLPVYAIVLISVGCTLLAAAGAFCVYFFLTKKKAAKVAMDEAETLDENTEEPIEETAEEAEEVSEEDNQSQD